MRFTSQVQTCLATNQVVAGCENLLQKVESSSTFGDEIFYMLRVLPAQDRLVLQQVTWPGSKLSIWGYR